LHWCFAYVAPKAGEALMSNAVLIGKTLDDSIKFTFGNAGALIRIGWLPFALTIGLTSFLAWYFWQPIILAYMDFLNAYAEVATDPVALEQLSESFTRDLENAIEIVGPASLMLGYAAVLIIGIVGAAIVLTAYVRMMALGERPGGFAYLRFGNRELGVAITYLLVTVIAAFAAIAITMLVAMLLVAPFAGNGGAGSAFAALAVFASMILSLVAFFWIFARLVVAAPASALHGGVPLGRAWQASKGEGSTITWILILGYLIMFAVSVIAMMILGMVTGLIDSVLVGMGSQLAPYFTGALWYVGYIAIACLSNAFFVGLFTGVYMQLEQGEAGEVA